MCGVCLEELEKMEKYIHLPVACSSPSDTLTRDHHKAPPLFDMSSSALQAVRVTAPPIMEERGNAVNRRRRLSPPRKPSASSSLV